MLAEVAARAVAVAVPMACAADWACAVASAPPFTCKRPQALFTCFSNFRAQVRCSSLLQYLQHVPLQALLFKHILLDVSGRPCIQASGSLLDFSHISMIYFVWSASSAGMLLLVLDNKRQDDDMHCCASSSCSVPCPQNIFNRIALDQATQRLPLLLRLI